MRFSTLSALGLAVLARSASASWGITGATSGIDNSTGARPFRLPIEELSTSGAQWDLYTQALQYWTSLDQTNMFSWYQIAAIHGLPNEAWDGATSASGDGGYYVGYCRHNSVLFPTWHRVYMALYEEVISIYAHQIAETYPSDKVDQYRAAADQLRMPYWDWSTSASIPDIMQQETITINAAWGSETINNPLHRYDFHPYDASAMDNIYSQYNYTIRAPAQQGQQTADQQLQANAQQFHDGVYSLFASQPNYTLFSNAGANNGQGGYQSIENIHNTIHNSIGGDMAYLWSAAQDPVFFLHHANVDRLITIWQAIYPDSWVTPQANSLGAYDVAPNTVETSTTGLSPFHKDDQGNFFTSDDVRDLKKFGYAYREVVDWNVTKEQLTQNVKATVNKIYNPNGSTGATSKRDGQVSKAATASDNQYVLNIQVNKSKINGTMTMNFAINNQSVGSFPILMGGNTMMGMANNHGVSGGQMTLTHNLIGLGCNLNDRNGTLDTIAKGMSWTGTYATGQTVQASDLQNGAVTIQVSTRQVQQTSPDDEFPIYQDWVHMAESQLGDFASQVLGVDENTIKQVTDGIESAMEGIL